MPTGYTYAIENGTVKTGKEFLERCLYNFGVSIDYRDDPIDKKLPEKLVIDERYNKNIKNAMKKLSDIESLSDKDISERKLKEIAECLKKDENTKEERKRVLNSYKLIRDEILNWTPPTSEHEGIKKFALEQIDMCIPTWSDEETYDYYRKYAKTLEDQSVEDYKHNLIADAQKDLENALKYKREEEDRISARNKFLKEFRDSIKNM